LYVKPKNNNNIMGADTFTDIQVVKGGFNEAYSQALDEARDYNGHQDGYSGDIQTTSTPRKAFNVPRYDTKKFWDWLDNEYSMMDKRDARWFEITGAVATRIKQRKGYKGRKGIRVFFFYGWGAS
jgi:hypothetical protein